MKITDVKTHLLTGPLTGDKFFWTRQRSAAFIEIETDEGVTGLGETYAGYFFPEGVPAIVEFFKPILIGQNVDDIPTLWERMYQCGNFWCRVGLGAIVLTAVEAALWDLKGKLLGKPVHELLGGTKHKKLLAYATGGSCPKEKDQIAAKIDYYLAGGFKAFKVAGHAYEEGLQKEFSPEAIAEYEYEKVAFMREVAGRDIEILMDGHMSNQTDDVKIWDVNIAKAVMKALESFNVFLFEEPLHYNDLYGYAELRKDSKVPIAGGECLTYSEWDVFVNMDCFDIAQPDASYLGGLTIFRDIADRYHAKHKKIATHAWGAAGSLMQNVHAAFASESTCILEMPAYYAGLHADIMVEQITLDDGYVSPPTAPGLGLQLTDEIKAKYPFVPGTGEFNSVPGKILTAS